MCAQRLPIRSVPEKQPISTVGLDVVDDSGDAGTAFALHCAPGMCSKKRRPLFLPAGVITSLLR